MQLQIASRVRQARVVGAAGFGFGFGAGLCRTQLSCLTLLQAHGTGAVLPNISSLGSLQQLR